MKGEKEERKKGEERKKKGKERRKERENEAQMVVSSIPNRFTILNIRDTQKQEKNGPEVGTNNS